MHERSRFCVTHNAPFGECRVTYRYFEGECELRTDFGIPRYALLDVWMALGGVPRAFDEWMKDDPRRTDADAWAQLMNAVRGNLIGLLEDTNPPAGALLVLVESRTVGVARDD